MPSEYTQVLELNQFRKSDRVPVTIYADLESLTVKNGGCKINLEKSSTKKVSGHILSCFSMSTVSSFKGIEIKHDLYRGKDYIKSFCES